MVCANKSNKQILHLFRPQHVAFSRIVEFYLNYRGPLIGLISLQLRSLGESRLNPMSELLINRFEIAIASCNVVTSWNLLRLDWLLASHGLEIVVFEADSAWVVTLKSRDTIVVMIFRKDGAHFEVGWAHLIAELFHLGLLFKRVLTDTSFMTNRRIYSSLIRLNNSHHRVLIRRCPKWDVWLRKFVS